MLHLWVIALYLSIVWRDMIDAPLLGSWLGVSETAVATLGPMLVIAAFTVAAVSRLTRHVEASGSYRAVRSTDRLLTAGRWGAVLVHVVGVLVLGWLDAVRLVVGDLILVDELIAMAPAIAVFTAGWWSVYPLERLLRESAIYRTLHAEPPASVPGDDPLPADAVGETAEPGVLYHIPSRREFVLLNIRHQLLLTLAPLLMLGAWGELSQWATGAIGRAAAEAIERALERGEAPPGLMTVVSDPGFIEMTRTLLQLAGVLAIFIAAPLIMRLVWDTSPLAPGPTRDRLEALCRTQGVRVREILVWRTHGTLMNAAVMGLVPRVRYVLLSDVMLDTMPMRELEAVMAHELAHVKHRHILWLGLSLMVSVAVAATAAAIGAAALGYDPAGMHDDGVLEIALTIGSLSAAMMVFGFVSRRFEWQADAFAAKCLSLPAREGEGGSGSGPSAIVSAAGVRAMVRALELVARINHIPRQMPSWRHGSIALRQRKLESIAGVPASRVPADRIVRIIKWLVGLAALGLVALSLGLLGGPPG